jgi:hypothetical protein
MRQTGHVTFVRETCMLQLHCYNELERGNVREEIQFALKKKCLRV